jgi:hypothetical protein
VKLHFYNNYESEINLSLFVVSDGAVIIVQCYNCLQWRNQELFSDGFTPEIFRKGSFQYIQLRIGQREWGSRGGSLLVRGSTPFANE